MLDGAGSRKPVTGSAAKVGGGGRALDLYPAALVFVERIFGNCKLDGTCLRGPDSSWQLHRTYSVQVICFGHVLREHFQ
jgi:hypothetical protein